MDYTQLLIEFLKLFFTLLAVALAAWFAFKKYLKENIDKKELMVNAVFGDLANIVEHYTYAKNEIALAMISEREKKIRLKFSKFGTLKSLEKIDQLGNLSTHQIRLILQLNLRIRNTDLLLDYFSESQTLLNETEIEQIKTRMHFCIYTAIEIIESIYQDRENLKTEWIKINHKLR